MPLYLITMTMTIYDITEFQDVEIYVTLCRLTLVKCNPNEIGMILCLGFI